MNCLGYVYYIDGLSLDKSQLLKRVRKSLSPYSFGVDDIVIY